MPLTSLGTTGASKSWSSAFRKPEVQCSQPLEHPPCLCFVSCHSTLQHDLEGDLSAPPGQNLPAPVGVPLCACFVQRPLLFPISGLNSLVGTLNLLQLLAIPPANYALFTSGSFSGLCSWPFFCRPSLAELSFP